MVSEESNLPIRPTSSIPEITNESWEKAKKDLMLHLEDFGNDGALFTESIASDAIFENKSFESHSLKRVALSNVTFVNCSFKKAAGTGSEFSSCKFIDCNFNGSNFQFADFESSAFTSSDKNDGTTFVGANLGGANFSRCIFNNTFFESTSLSNCLFESASLSSCTIKSCTLEGAIFRYATLYKIDLGRVNIEYVDFVDAMFDNVKVPIMQLPYTFGGFSNYFTSHGLEVTSDKASKQGKSISKYEYRELLSSMETYFIKFSSYFPLANLYLSLNRADDFDAAIRLGFFLAFERNKFREIKYLSKLVSVSNIYESSQLQNLYELVESLRKNNEDNPIFRNNYALHAGEIDLYLNKKQGDWGRAKFVIGGDISKALTCTNNIFLTLEQCNDYLELEGSITHVSLRKNSPIEIIMEYATSVEGTVTTFMLATGYLLKGSSKFLKELIELRVQLNKTKQGGLKKKMKELRKEIKLLNVHITKLKLEKKLSKEKQIIHKKKGKG